MQETEDEDWVVDQVVVEREERDEGTRKATGTNTGSRSAPSQTDGSPDVGAETRSYYTGMESWSHWTWRRIHAFFAPKFDDVSTRQCSPGVSGLRTLIISFLCSSARRRDRSECCSSRQARNAFPGFADNVALSRPRRGIDGLSHFHYSF